MLSFLQAIFIVLTVPAQITLGKKVTWLALKDKPNSGLTKFEYYTIGILTYLIGLLALLVVGFPLSIASLCVILPVFLFPKDILDNIKSLSKSVPSSLNFALWFTVSLILGISIFDVSNAIETIWVNNYGDLTYHIGMISSFVNGNNLPPEQHIFAGERLSYPFLINLWTASMWWISPKLTNLDLIFTVQWMIVWIGVYFLLNPKQHPILPWLVLFGGGTFFALGTHSSKLLNADYPWSVFITTIWITQRTTLLGLLVLFTVLKIFFRYENNPNDNRHLKLATLLLSFSPLAHTHFFLITALFIGMQILLQAKLRKDLTVFLLYLLPSLLSLPWLVGKENLIKFVPGWLAWHKFDPTLWGNILNSTYMWLANAWGWFLLLGLVWYLSKKHTHLISITILFLAANFVQIAIWEWDQIKVFIALYLLSIAVWSSLESKISLKLEYVLLILTLPALAELKTVFAEYKKNTPYNKEELQVALKLMEHTEPEAIILTAPTHNSPATLSGRKLFLGYIGTLHSHGIRYHKRQKLTQSLRSAINCKKTNPELPCPDYLLWNTHEKNHWKGEDPSRYENLAPTELPFLYKIK